MSLYITSLNSGSNGNCYYVGNHDEAILVDVGLSCREVEKRMSRLNLSLQKVKAIFISHEHSDHIRGINVLVKKHQIPVYISEGTYYKSGINIPQHLINYFQPNEKVSIGTFTVDTFPKHHDAKDPHSFTITDQQTKIGVFTDIGITCDLLIHHFQSCNAAFLECNYDEEMLINGRYPYFLKKRISGGKGHLSNKQALDLFTTYKPSFMSHVFLSHLSKDNNNPDLAKELFSKYANGTKVIIASRTEETPVYFIPS